MKFIKFLLLVIVFGIVMAKSEAISWFRIQEMFRFQAFHMYGIIMTAIGVGVIGIQIAKRKQLKDINGNLLIVQDKEKGNARYWIGGILFGLGWAMVGACPGPIFIMLGAGFLSVGLILIGAVLGTFLYGVVKDTLPH